MAVSLSVHPACSLCTLDRRGPRGSSYSRSMSKRRERDSAALGTVKLRPSTPTAKMRMLAQIQAYMHDDIPERAHTVYASADKDTVMTQT